MKTQTFFLLYIAVIFLAAAVFSSCDETAEDMEIEPEVSEIVITNPSDGKMELVKDSMVIIRYHVLPQELRDSAVIEWSSSNDTVVTVKDGRVKACAPGNAVISACCGRAKASVKVRVLRIPATSFESLDYYVSYVGFTTEIKVGIEPEKADATSLDWYYDKELVALSFKDGRAFFTGLKTGICKVSVISDNGELKHFQLQVREASSRFNVKACSFKNLSDGDECDWDTLMVKNNFYNPYIYISLNSDMSVKNDLSITSSNKDFCDVEFGYSSYDRQVRYNLKYGGGFGSSVITVRVKDEFLGIEHKMSFTVKRTKKGIPGEMVVEGYNIVMKDGGSYKLSISQYKHSFYINSGYLAKWSFSGDVISDIKFLGGDEFWAAGVEFMANKCGETTVTVTDQTGKSISFKLIIYQYAANVKYLIDSETGDWVSKFYIPDGSSRDFELSLSGRMKWELADTRYFSIEPLDEVDGYCSKIRIKATKDALGKSTTLRITDMKGHYNDIGEVVAALKLDKRQMCICAESEPHGIASTRAFWFTWKGARTNFSKTFYVSRFGERLTKLPGIKMSVEKSNSNSDFRVVTSDSEIETTGNMAVRWPSKHGMRVILKLTDPWGNTISREIEPVCDFKDPKWKIRQEYGSMEKTTFLGIEVALVGVKTLNSENGWSRYKIGLLYDTEAPEYAVTDLECSIWAGDIKHTPEVVKILRPGNLKEAVSPTFIGRHTGNELYMELPYKTEAKKEILHITFDL